MRVKNTYDDPQRAVLKSLAREMKKVAKWNVKVTPLIHNKIGKAQQRSKCKKKKKKIVEEESKKRENSNSKMVKLSQKHINNYVEYKCT